MIKIQGSEVKKCLTKETSKEIIKKRKPLNLLNKTTVIYPNSKTNSIKGIKMWNIINQNNIKMKKSQNKIIIMKRVVKNKTLQRLPEKKNTIKKTIPNRFL